MVERVVRYLPGFHTATWSIPSGARVVTVFVVAEQRRNLFYKIYAFGRCFRFRFEKWFVHKSWRCSTYFVFFYIFTAFTSFYRIVFRMSLCLLIYFFLNGMIYEILGFEVLWSRSFGFLKKKKKRRDLRKILWS